MSNSRSRGNDDSPDASEPIHTRWLSVSYVRPKPKGPDEQLIYAPQAVEDLGGTRPAMRTIRSDTVRSKLADLQKSVYDLTRLALRKEPRGKLGIEQAATDLARQVLPPDGLARLVGFGVHPVFQLYQDVAAQIPWETMEETYSTCSNEACPNSNSAVETTFGDVSPSGFCRRCAAQMQHRGGKLATSLHLSHAVIGERGAELGGRRFFLFVDPHGDLCHPEHDPTGICSGHILELRTLLEQMGYEVCLFEGPNVTSDRLLSALSDSSTRGVYYFGHGVTEAGEGALRLADGELRAGRFSEASASARFVFLNACEGAAAGTGWNPDDTQTSVAMALAHSGRWKTVIAPIWPIANAQAAESASIFFRAAQRSRPLGAAMRDVREASLQQYREGAAHLSWFQYRFFGSPASVLPPVGMELRGSPTKPSHLFDAEGLFNPDCFGFAIDELLVRAASRRNSEGRPQVTVMDLVVALLRRGDLTRYVLTTMLVHPDVVLQRLGDGTATPASDAAKEPDTGSDVHHQALNALAKVSVGKRSDFEPEVVRLLEAAEAATRQRPESDRRISEADLLSQVLGHASWDGFAKQGFLAAQVLDWLRVVMRRREVDANGQVLLGNLSSEARRVIEAAHLLARQRGTSPISHRLVLAAFLSDDKGHAAHCCRTVDQDPESLFELMLAAQGTGDRAIAPPQNFGLTPELCARAITPALETARRRAPQWRTITEAELFVAFCERADPAFKATLGVFGVDLDQLGKVAPASGRGDVPIGPETGPAWLRELDRGAQDVVLRAHDLAQRLGVFPVPAHLLLASFFYDAERHVLSHRRPERALVLFRLRDWLLERAALLERAPVVFPLDEMASQLAIEPIVQRALELGPERPVDERRLFRAFCEAMPEELRRALESSGWHFRLEDLLDESPCAPSAPPPTPAKPAKPGVSTPSVVVPPPDPPPDGSQVTLSLPATIKQDQLGDDVSRCLRRAARLARAQGHGEIRSPHLFVAMLEEGLSDIPVLGALSPHQRQVLGQLVAELVPERAAGHGQTVSLSRNAAVALERGLAWARRAGRAAMSLADLAGGFFEDGGGVVGELLRKLGESRDDAHAQAQPRGGSDLN